MDAYSPKRRCLKCGYGKAASRYHDEQQRKEYRTAANPCFLTRKEHIDRVCGRCGYTWQERVLGVGRPVRIRVVKEGSC